MEASTPVPATPECANASSIALQILEDEKVQEAKDLSPETQALRKRLVRKAKEAVKDPAIDQGGLEDGWKLLRKLMDSKTEIKTLQAQFKETSTELQMFKFLVSIGDWTMAIHNHVKTFETSVIEDWKKEYQAKLIASGTSGPQAQIDAEAATVNFAAIKGLQASETLEVVNPELDLVRTWRDAGELEGTEPSTPYLDRLDSTCKKAGISRRHYLELNRVCHQRNEAAHTAPPAIEDHFTTGNEVDWQAIWAICKTRKYEFKVEYLAGRITKDQYAFAIKTINKWFSNYVEGWKEDGSAIETKFAAKVRPKVFKDKERKRKRLDALQPESPYKKGKWDDI